MPTTTDTTTTTPAATRPAPKASRAKVKRQRTIREAITKVLADADEPMTPADIYKEIRRRRLAPGLKGKTPEATIAAKLSVHGEFERTERSHYKLAS